MRHRRKFSDARAARPALRDRHRSDRRFGFAAARGLAQLAHGSLPDHIPFGDTTFDLVVMTDVLEHLDDENGSLRALRARLRSRRMAAAYRPGIIMAVERSRRDASSSPALSRERIARGRERRGLQGEYLSYYNFLLFPMIATVRDCCSACERPDQMRRRDATTSRCRRDRSTRSSGGSFRASDTCWHSRDFRSGSR